MGHSNCCLRLKLPIICVIVLLLSLIIFEASAFSITASIGRPYQGRLINGVPFPNQFQGYTLRDPERSYATPEAIGTVLDAIDAVREQYPDTCDLYFGDFSHPRRRVDQHAPIPSKWTRCGLGNVRQRQPASRHLCSHE